MSSTLTVDQMTSIFRRPDAVKALPDHLQGSVRAMFVKSFNLQMRILIGFAVAQVPVTFLTWRREQIRID